MVEKHGLTSIDNSSKVIVLTIVPSCNILLVDLLFVAIRPVESPSRSSICNSLERKMRKKNELSDKKTCLKPNVAHFHFPLSLPVPSSFLRSLSFLPKTFSQQLLLAVEDSENRCGGRRRKRVRNLLYGTAILPSRRVKIVEKRAFHNDTRTALGVQRIDCSKLAL